MGELVGGPSFPGFPVPGLVQASTPAGTVTYEGPTIMGIPMPGQWLLKKAKRVWNIQQQRAAYMSGSVLVPTSVPAMEISYEIRIWESGAMSQFLALVGSVLKQPVLTLGAALPASAALAISDPALHVYGVSNVVLVGLEVPKNPLVSSGGRGPWVGSIDLLEYVGTLKKMPPPPDQTLPITGVTAPPAASNNLATVGAAMLAGDAARQAAAASALVPPR